MTMDIPNFYPMASLKRPEYILINIRDTPEEIILEYNLREMAMPNGSVHIMANQGTYGLPQSALLANKLLEKNSSTREVITNTSWYQDCGSVSGNLCGS